MATTTSQAESFRPLGLGPGLFAVILIAAVRRLQHLYFASYIAYSNALSDFFGDLRGSSKPEAGRVLMLAALCPP